jgi:hypothetical protein
MRKTKKKGGQANNETSKTRKRGGRGRNGKKGEGGKLKIGES